MSKASSAAEVTASNVRPANRHSLFEQDVVLGLSGEPKSLPCKWLYDAKGSRLFEQICDTEEYYVTRTELALLKTVLPQVAAKVGANANVIEPGSGAGVKTILLLEALETPRSYCPIEISETAMAEAAAVLRTRFSELLIIPTVADFTQPFTPPPQLRDDRENPRLIFFPGSTVGNFPPEQARDLLGSLRQQLRPGDWFLIGVDVPKDLAVLEAAYDDASGVTAAFNLNLLERINTELEASIEPHRFAHQATFNQAESRMEMHLVSKVAQEIEVAGQGFTLAAGETIHTENSYKYSVDRFLELARPAGFEPEQTFTDPKGWFSIHLLKAI